MAADGDFNSGGDLNSDGSPLPPQTSSLYLAEKLSSDYAGYLVVSAQKEKKAFSENAEDLLVKLGEFCEDVDAIRQDMSLSLAKTVPEIQAKTADLEVIFDRIDKLERFVGIIRANLDALEKDVQEAESSMPSSGPRPLLKIVGDIFGKRTSDAAKGQTKQRGCPRAPVPVFKTSDYIVPSTALASSSSGGGSSSTKNA